MVLNIGDVAPDFTLPDQDGRAHRLADYRGQPVLIYFYPKDDTPGCTTEACGFRDEQPQLSGLQLAVLGISADSVADHKKFALKFNLNFPLLSDPEKKVITAYDAWKLKKFMGREYMGIVRMSYLVDKSGLIAKIYPAVKPAEHPQEVVKDVANLA